MDLKLRILFMETSEVDVMNERVHETGEGASDNMVRETEISSGAAQNHMEYSSQKRGISRLAFRALKLTVFVLLLALIVYCLNQTITPKYVYSNATDPMSSVFSGLYEMEENTVDVIFLGSSHTGSGLNPQDMYDEAGIRSYNLASSSQSILLSYFWLKEALNYQSPKIVVLDCYELFISGTSEAAARKALDYMRDGEVKSEAVQAIVADDETQSELSYTLSNVRYHTRWSELTEEDYTWAEEDVTKLAKGFYKKWGYCNDETYVPLEFDESEITPAEFDETAEEYLDKIVSLCEEKGIELILIKTPAHSQTAERHVAVQNYADEHGLTFYDFNMKDLYEEIGFEYATDMHDSSTTGTMNAHANPSGARKMSQYLANEILGVNGLEGVEDSQWEETREFNEHIWQNFTLKHEEDLLTYLEMLDEERYSILISVRDEASKSLNEEVLSAMQNLGFEFTVYGNYRYSYVAIKNEGEIIELLNEDLIETAGSLRNGRVPYLITSGGYIAGSTSSIIIDGTEYSKNKRGLNIVVYDNEMKLVVDQVNFDTFSEAWTAYR